MRRMPLASNSAERLEAARSQLHDKNTVCFLGESKSGKTVSSSLLKHAIINYFVPKFADDYQAIVSQGMESINKSLGDMIIHRQFPASTPPVSDPRVVLTIYKMSGPRAGTYDVILRDPSGEHFFNYLINECDDPKYRLNEILGHSINSNQVGPLAHYVFARIYILTVDCSDTTALAHSQSLLANAITTLHRLHSAASLTCNNKITSPIAILFTKADLLNAVDSAQDPTDILERMPELTSALRMLHGGALDSFMVSVSTRAESEHDKVERVQHKKELYEKQYAAAMMERNEMEKKISAKCASERKKVEDDMGDSELESYMSEYREKIRSKMDMTPVPKKFDEENVLSEQTHRPVSPLAYSHEEYVRLTMWIISQLAGLR